MALAEESPAPSRVASVSVTNFAPTRISLNFLRSDSSPPIISHLEVFSRRPIDAPLLTIFLMSCERTVTSPAREQSSKYQTQRGETHSCNIRLMARQNRRGPKGSPCWTPSDESNVHFPKFRVLSEEYAHFTNSKIEDANSATDARTASLLMLLKAFAKSSLTSASQGFMLLMNVRTAWTAASAPPLTPTPTCTGDSKSDEATDRQATLAMRRRNVPPIAIGRAPPSFFSNESNLQPKNLGRIAAGMLPLRQRFVNDKREFISFTAPSKANDPVSCLRCDGLSPSNPPAEAQLNDLIASIN